jgi:hypothetical protein
MMADKSNPASLNARGNANAPAPTMRLKIYTNPTCYKKKSTTNIKLKFNL